MRHVLLDAMCVLGQNPGKNPFVCFAPQCPACMLLALPAATPVRHTLLLTKALKLTPPAAASTDKMTHHEANSAAALLHCLHSILHLEQPALRAPCGDISVILQHTARS
jgi:hypothetical protein